MAERSDEDVAHDGAHPTASSPGAVPRVASPGPAERAARPEPPVDHARLGAPRPAGPRGHEYDGAARVRDSVVPVDGAPPTQACDKPQSSGAPPGSDAPPGAETTGLAPRRGARAAGPAVALLGSDTLALVLALLVCDAKLLRAVVLVPALLLLNATGGLYRARLALYALEEFPTLALRGAAGIAVVLIGGHSLRCGWLDLPDDRSAFFTYTASYLALSCGFRAVLYAARRRARRRHGRPTLLLGAGAVNQRIAATLREHPEYGLRPVGFLDEQPSRAADSLLLPRLGGHADLAAVALRMRVRDVLVDTDAYQRAAVGEAVEVCRAIGCQTHLVPAPPGGRFVRLPAEDHVRAFAVRYPARPAGRWTRLTAKRLVDTVGATFGLLLAAPLLALCALAVRLDGGPGVLFRQERIGEGGGSFTVWKFRTLTPSTDAESATRWSITHDGRLTPLGNLLRRSSLDELPQLFNVLRGDMSLVGPRPERPHFVSRFTHTHPGYAARHRMPTGLTGLAQVNGLRGDTSIEDRARFDNYYIEHWSLWQDVVILLRTVGALVRPNGG